MTNTQKNGLVKNGGVGKDGECRRESLVNDAFGRVA